MVIMEFVQIHSNYCLCKIFQDISHIFQDISTAGFVHRQDCSTGGQGVIEKQQSTDGLPASDLLLLWIPTG